MPNKSIELQVVKNPEQPGLKQLWKLSVDFLKSANEELIKENKALIKENKELKKKIEELESRALINPRKVTDEQVKKIKELRASGLSYRAIVKEIGLSTCTIQRALKGIYD